MEKAALFKETPADVVISAVLAEPMGRQREFVQLKNLGGQEQDLEGWRLVLTNSGDQEESFTFAAAAGCPTKIAPQAALLVLKKDAANPCGFAFDLGPSEELVLFEPGADAEGIDSLTWGNIGKGLVLYRSSDDTYEKAPQNVEGNTIDVLRRLGGFNDMVTFLQHFDLDKILEGRGVRNTGTWHNKIVREMDYDIPYTLFAVKDEEWRKLYKVSRTSQTHKQTKNARARSHTRATHPKLTLSLCLDRSIPFFASHPRRKWPESGRPH